MRATLEQLVPPVFRFALRLTGDRDAAEDLVQETMLRAWRHRERWDEIDELRVWLFRVAANLHRDGLRRGAVRARLDRHDPRLTPRFSAPAPEQRSHDRETLDAALAALDGLPDRQREVLFLSACEGCTIAQIATVLDISPAAAKASLSLARQRVRTQLNPQPHHVKPTDA